MARHMNHARTGKRFAKTYSFELPDRPAGAAPKNVAATPKQPATMTPEQVERQVELDKKNRLKTDADVILVNLKYGTPTSKADLKALLGKVQANIDEKYMMQLLAYLLEKRKIVADGAGWKRA